MFDSEALHENLCALARSVPSDGFGLLTLGLPTRAPERLWAARSPHPAHRPSHYFATAEGDREAGLGCALELRGEGPDRFASVRSQARERACTFIERRLGVEEAPPVRFAGGARFVPAGAQQGPWRDFADASFAMARWTLATTGGGESTLRLCVAKEELESPKRLVEETQALWRTLEADANRSSSLQSGAPGAVDGAVFAGASEEGSVTAFRGRVAEALAQLGSGALQKVVLARSLEVAAAGWDWPTVLGRLVAVRGWAHFAWVRGDALFLGASPERLVTLSGDQVETEALAGSVPRRAGDAVEVDDARKAQLLRSSKDRREHAWVVQSIAEALRPLCTQLELPAEPGVRTLAHLHHLHTPVRASLSRPMHVLELVERLHPTPAVGGVPREEALRFLRDREELDRGWYAAPVGWFDTQGNGSFAVALRCALLGSGRTLLFAGAGVVAGSDADAEALETRAKLRPMLELLGVA